LQDANTRRPENRRAIKPLAIRLNARPTAKHDAGSEIGFERHIWRTMVAENVV